MPLKASRHTGLIVIRAATAKKSAGFTLDIKIPPSRPGTCRRIWLSSHSLLLDLPATNPSAMRVNDAINQGDAIISQPITLTSAKPDRASAIPLMDIIRLIGVVALCQSAEAIFGRVYVSTGSAIMLPTETIAIKT
ncbi:hypothetical protein Rmet_1545 [Cupriavidus metallidurans CH34]|uniref:Uncharacterized protein n=1 Tax=Cupriavidus metallidurans (strain ATCC 43123 / DSM 2839 / NBRC 102507 / CH34) TaxID=266264 RepID=Q1LN48_CUPMC|nr:hypothetical protein Rmet_1545 [Cupriavidus metallidurans CH34]